MKKIIISVILLIICFSASSLGSHESFETKILKHPLAESYDFDASNDTFGYNFILKLKNGHEIYFRGVKDDLTFNKWSGILYVNDGSNEVEFEFVEYKNSINKGGCSHLRIKDLCKATGTEYNDVFSILDNYNEFCKLLNSLPWNKDKSAEKVCAKYTDKYCVYLFRGSLAIKDENKFIKIPNE